MFVSRRQAGTQLASRLKKIKMKDPIVLALPRGGVPVGFEISKALKAPLDVVIVRKIGAPLHPEFGIGAVTEDGFYLLDPKNVEESGATPQQINEILKQEKAEVDRRKRIYRDNIPLPDLYNRTVILTDDGMATGVTAKVAVEYLNKQAPHQIIVAVPACSPRTASELRPKVDELIALNESDLFFAVGQFYEEFEQLTDEQVLNILRSSKDFLRKSA